MRLLLLENFAEINVSHEDLEEKKKNSQWKVIGISSSSNQLVDNLKWDSSKLQAVLQDGLDFAILNLRTMEISKLELVNSVAESCIAFVISPDGQTFFGFQSNGGFVAVCDNSERVKQIRSGYGMTISKRPSLIDRMFSNVKAIFGYVSPSQNQIVESGEDGGSYGNYEKLFPILQSTKDGLALVCYFKPGEGFLFTCSYSVALKHKHVSNIVGDRVPGRWWRIFTDEVIVLNWLRNHKTLPVVEIQVDHSKSQQREPYGVIAYSAFANKNLEILYGQFDKIETKYEVKWGLILYEFDWIILEDTDSSVGNGKINFITKISGKADKIAIAVNTYMGVYIHVQNLPGQGSQVKLERMTVPLCPHCDYGNAIYYDEECWISSIEWLSDDCYFACITRCGSLSVFHKSGEVMIMKMNLSKYPTSDLPCNFFHEVFNIRTETEQAKEKDKTNCIEDNKNESEVGKISRKVLMTWSSGDENVLGVFSGSKISFIRVLRVSNYFGICDIKIPLSSMLLKAENPEDSFVPQTPSETVEKSNRNLQLWDMDNENDFKKDNDGDKVWQQALADKDADSGERIISSINDFVSSLPEAEIILRPVFVSVNAQGSRKPPVQFKFRKDGGKDTDGNWKPDALTSDENNPSQQPLDPNNCNGTDNRVNEDGSPLPFPEMETDFTLLSNFPIYTADDEGTDVRVASQESTSCGPGWENECVTSEPQLRPEYPDDYTYPHDSEDGKSSDIDVKSVSDRSYSPPFTDDEADEKLVQCSTKETDPLGLLAIKAVPKIDGVIPYVASTQFETVEESPIECKSSASNKCIATQTESIIDDDEYRNTGSHSERCRPICMLTKPPPPTKAPSQQYFIISDRKRIEATISSLTDRDHPIVFINKLDDDQLGPCPTTNTSRQEMSKLNNPVILEGKISETVTDRLQQLKSDCTEANTPEDTSENKITDPEEDKDKLSRERWEKLTGMFDRKTKRSKNRTTKKPQPSRMGTNVSSNGPIDEDWNKEEDPKDFFHSLTTAEEGEDDEDENTLSPKVKSSLVPSKNNSSTKLVKSSLKNSRMVQAGESKVTSGKKNEMLVGKTLPTNSSKDDRMIEILRKKLVSLSTRQENKKADKGSNSDTFLNWLGSEMTTLNFSPSEQETILQYKRPEKLKASSQPDFQKKFSSEILKKAILSEPQLSKKIKVDLLLKKPPHTEKLKTIPNIVAVAVTKSASPSKPLVQDFTVGLGPTIATAAARPKTARVVKKSVSQEPKQSVSTKVVKPGRSVSASETAKKILSPHSPVKTVANEKRPSTQMVPSVKAIVSSSISKKLSVSKASSASVSRVSSATSVISKKGVRGQIAKSPPAASNVKRSAGVTGIIKRALTSNKESGLNKPLVPASNTSQSKKLLSSITNKAPKPHGQSHTSGKKVPSMTPEAKSAAKKVGSKVKKEVETMSEASFSKVIITKSGKTIVVPPENSSLSPYPGISQWPSPELVLQELQDNPPNESTTAAPSQQPSTVPGRSTSPYQLLSRWSSELEDRHPELQPEEDSLSKISKCLAEASLNTVYVASEPTTDEDDYEKTVGKGLTIHTEVMENVPLRSSRSQMSNGKLDHQSNSTTHRSKRRNDEDTDEDESTFRSDFATTRRRRRGDEDTDDEGRADRSHSARSHRKRRSDDDTDDEGRAERHRSHSATTAQRKRRSDNDDTDSVSDDGLRKKCISSTSTSRSRSRNGMKRRVSFSDPIAVFKVMPPVGSQNPESEDDSMGTKVFHY